MPGDLVNVTNSSPQGGLLQRDIINLVTSVQSQVQTPEWVFGAHCSPMTTIMVYLHPQINAQYGLLTRAISYQLLTRNPQMTAMN